MPKAKTNLKLSEQDTMRLLQLYQSETCLYDINSDDYRNRDLRAVAAMRIAEALNVQDFGPKEVVTKFKNLRNSYSQELKKMKDSEIAGAPTNNVYVTKVYWFEIMDSFLRPFIYLRPTQLNLVIGRKRQKEGSTSESPAGQDDENNEDEDTGGGCLREQIKKTEKCIGINPNVLNNKGGEVKSALPVIESACIENKEMSFMKDKTSHSRKLCPGDMDNVGREVEPESYITIAPGSTEHGTNNSRKRKGTASQNTNAKHSYQTLNVAHDMSRSDDMFDHYGKYVASLLRTVGNPKAIMIQQEIATVILKHMCDDTRLS